MESGREGDRDTGMDRDMRGSPISVGQRDLTRDRDSHGARAPYTGQGHPWDTGTGAGTPHGTGTRTRMGQRHPLVKLTPHGTGTRGQGRAPAGHGPLRKRNPPREQPTRHGTAKNMTQPALHGTGDTTSPSQIPARDTASPWGHNPQSTGHRGHDIPFSDTPKGHSIPLGMHPTHRTPLSPRDTTVPKAHLPPPGGAPITTSAHRSPPAPFIPHGWSRFGPAGVAGSAQGRSAGR